jgi:hypothetical protein
MDSRFEEYNQFVGLEGYYLTVVGMLVVGY